MNCLSEASKYKHGIFRKADKRVGKINQKQIIMSYPLVEITNSTNFIVSGKVDYMSAFCSDDNYSVTPNTTWKAKSRGVCLLTKVSATVKTPNGEIVAKSYESSGTSYSRFAIIQTGPSAFEVTRIVNLVEENIPEDYLEPTAQQK